MNEKVEYQAPLTVKAGQIQFIQACHPPLVAGEYKAGMRQVIKEAEDAAVPWNSDPYLSDLVFAVDAPRFTFNTSDIHSVYPPVNSSGSFNNSLPHVVFARRTLPWERTLDGKPPEFGQAFPAWLGILLLTEDELTDPATGRMREVVSLPILSKDKDSLLISNKEKVLVPDLGQDGSAGTADQKFRSEKWVNEKWRYEMKTDDGKEKELCLAIDLPADLFKAIAPRYDDLPYLAHVRQIDTGNKEVLGINDRGWFSLVTGNRLPQIEAKVEPPDEPEDKPEGQPPAGKRHHAFLVSFEGWQDRLKEDWQPADGQQVRLAVLGTWAFTCAGSNDFKAHMDLLNFDLKNPPKPAARENLPDSWLHLPYMPYDQSREPQNIVNAAFARGYTAFNHSMRQGEKTVSWYRGPLVPLNYDKPAQVQELVSCADELLRYDPEIGLFDVTYAAAWQLGRLLALQNQSFALALNRARKALRARAEWLMRRAELKERCTELDVQDEKFIEDSLMEKIADGTGDKIISAVPK
jgi:hypothetical protein